MVKDIQLTPQIMYEASLRKDAAYEGLFYMAVKTTGIFCRPTCTARKPKFENVAFYYSAREALLNGYRACKVCRPLQQTGNTPSYIARLIKELQDNPQLRLKDWDIKQRGLEPVTIRRWFKQHYSITFQAYQRLMRINKAFGQIKYGERISGAAYDSGYESLSGFQHSFQKATGITPRNSKNKTLITITRMDTPLGPMMAGATDEGICLFDFTERRMLENILKRLQQATNATLLPGEHPHFKVLHTQISEYFDGTRTKFDLPLHLIGSPFQQKVWRALIDIPYGKTHSYKQQSIHVGDVKAIRAVARANGENGIAIIIPCHRVIGENGHLTGYGGGLWRKKWLLEHEAKIAGDAIQHSLF